MSALVNPFCPQLVWLITLTLMVVSAFLTRAHANSPTNTGKSDCDGDKIVAVITNSVSCIAEVHVDLNLFG